MKIRADIRGNPSELGKSTGFVPTMGALHAGHCSLIKKSVQENDVTILSIFVNPTQFNNQQDLQNYPLTLDEDLKKAEMLGVNYVLLPDFETMYADDFRYKLEETEFSKKLCGQHREGHFTGVLTVVMKLLNLVQPTRAYFGEKDYQQYQLIKGMVDAFFMDVLIIACTTVREEDGLAMSSRNLNLDAGARKAAGSLNRLLKSEDSDQVVVQLLEAQGFDVDYVATLEGRRFAAASILSKGNWVRLIDNQSVSSS